MQGDGLQHTETRKLSSNNPFRTSVAPAEPPSRAVSAGLSNSAFDEWVQRNKQLIDSDEDNDFPARRPSFPTLSRTGSDTNVNYGTARYVSNLVFHEELFLTPRIPVFSFNSLLESPYFHSDRTRFLCSPPQMILSSNLSFAIALLEFNTSNQFLNVCCPAPQTQL